MKINKKLRIWTTIKTAKDEYVVTSNYERSVYTLYKKKGENDYEKIGTDSNPFDLEEKYVWKKGRKK